MCELDAAMDSGAAEHPDTVVLPTFQNSFGLFHDFKMRETQSSDSPSSNQNASISASFPTRSFVNAVYEHLLEPFLLQQAKIE